MYKILPMILKLGGNVAYMMQDENVKK